MEAQCQCGQFHAHAADEARPYVILCHCADCQRRSGSPFGMIAYYPDESVETGGRSCEFARDTYSGNRLVSQFCPECGSTLVVLLSKNPDLIGIPVGAFADPAFPGPDIAVWEQRRHDWIELPDGVHRFERGTDLK